MAAYEKIPEDKKIISFVEKYATSGKSLNAIFDLAAAQGFQNMPNSRTTFSKLYKKYVDKIKLDRIKEVADKVYERAVKEGDFGHFPSQELILKTQADWAVKNINVDVEVDEADTGAKAALLAQLGIDLDDENANK